MPRVALRIIIAADNPFAARAAVAAAKLKALVPRVAFACAPA
jgi:hypothetical protein